MTTMAANLDVTAIKCTPDELVVTWQNTTYSVYSALWLRDNDPAHRDASTGQRLVSLVDLPQEPKLHSAECWPPGHITLSWDDGKISVFSVSWLHAYDRSLRIGSRPMRMPWMGQPATDFAWCDYAEWVDKPAAREDWLYYAGRDGLAFLRDVPIEDSAVLRVAGQIGLVRETNCGRILDVRSLAQPNNLAYTSPGLRAHTDNPYSDPVPGFQLLHCLSAAAQGGETIFVDGMAAAERLRAHDAEAFSILCQTPILYRFQDAAVDLAAERTMLEIDTLGQFRAISYNDRSIAPLPLKGPLLRKYYSAYRKLAELLNDPARTVIYGLRPGDLALFDNTRLLHGRTAFSIDAVGEQSGRHLQGCYVEADGLYSTLAVLSRERISNHVKC
jgi:gamma-butyrobetaine dioxygenase